MHCFDMADFDRTDSIQRLTGNASDRVVFDADLSGHQPHTINCGVIFVHAFWAGSSRRTLAHFCQSIVRVDTDRRLRFIVCDIDDIPPLDPILYRGDLSGGNGDVFWMFNGQIVARHTASRSCDFDTANQSLIQCCSSARPDVETAATEMG
jgi:purine nucleoside permease